MWSLRQAGLGFLISLLPLAAAEPVQYCRNGYSIGRSDFCFGVSTFQNTTTHATDTYFALTVTRGSPLGWTAVGSGWRMDKSLMFIVYGDPSGSDPTVSIRIGHGHAQPAQVKPLTLSGGGQLEILRSKWRAPHQARHEDHHEDGPPSGPPTHIADVTVACYGCSSEYFSTTSGSEPFIWAWNSYQKFDSFAPDAKLKMHEHGERSGGHGYFHVDMARSLVDKAEAPAIQFGVDRIGTSDGPIGVGGFFSGLRERPLPRGHGFFMALAFLVLFPLGVVFMRTAGGNPFKRHWKMQMAATVTAWLGAVIAAIMTGGRKPKTFHQWAGIAVVLALGLQAVLGWRHHVVFLKVRGRTWISHVHIWLGRLVVLVGWLNVLSGMYLSNQGWLSVSLVAGLVLVEAVAVSLVVSRARRAARAGPGQVEAHALMPRNDGAEDYFALEMSDDEFDTDGEDDVKDKKEAGKDESKERLTKGVDAKS
ncbi:hypothetical protein OQA88_8935 [Cercophora sp. LCS_1]